jgi:hypothetical protein
MTLSLFLDDAETETVSDGFFSTTIFFDSNGFVFSTKAR